MKLSGRSRFLKPAMLAACGLLLYFSVPRPYLREGVGVSHAYYDRSGRLLRLTLAHDDKYRLWLPLPEIAPLAVKAVLLQEDRYFRWHPGLNPIALVRAFWKTYAAPRGRRYGGSTLTMQLARIRYRMDTRTVAGKVRQILKAIQMERHYTKDEILEAYLNLAPYGGNIEGVGAAAWIYFGKRAGRLTLGEALTLAAIPQNPSRRSPLYAKKNVEASRELYTARRALFERWAADYPEDSGQRALLNLPVDAALPSELPFLAPHFVDTLERLGYRQADTETTLDLKLQDLVEGQLKNYIAQKKKIGIHNAAALLVDARDMGVRAMVGSADFFNHEIQGQVNGTRAKRSPGSALKPFIYALGMEQGVIHPMTMLKDSPRSYGGFNPENFDNEFTGPIFARDALIRSRNVPALQVMNQLKSPSLYQFLRQANISQMRPESFYGLALALGGIEVTLEEMAELYAMLANEGVLRRLRYVRGDSEEEGRRLLSEETSALVLEIIENLPRPQQAYRKEWVKDYLPVSWKTGTSYAYRDAWTVGVFGHYVLAVWIGNFDGAGNPAFVGIDAAAPLFFRIVDALRSHEPDLEPSRHAGWSKIREVAVCSVSGQMPGPYCPHTARTWFIPGKSPIQTCEIHRQIYIDAKTGLQASFPGETGSKPIVYEFWPTDLLQVFRLAGIPRRQPPMARPGRLETKSGKGLPPQITSPQAKVVYNIRLRELGKQKIPLAAITDADARAVYWFADKNYLGKSKSSEPLFWTPKPGRFIVRAVDDHGRSDTRGIQVAVVE